MATACGETSGGSNEATGGDGTAPKVADFDELVDEILAKKGPAKYTGGLSEDNWEEELEQIPLFMTRPPDDINAETAPALAALQDLIYGEESRDSVAIEHKVDGNEQFKKRRYREAVMAYTAGLRHMKSGDRELTAVLLSNRAAARYHLGNYRSCLIDCDEARRADPDHMKAIIRGAECCMQLGRYAEAMKWCDDGLRLDEKHSRLRELRTKAAKDKKKKDKNRRKELATEKKKAIKDLELIQAIKCRGIRLQGEGDDGEDLHNINLTTPHPSGARVHISEDGVLTWPVMLLYPEFDQSDFISAFRENERFIDHLEVVLKHSPEWDKAKKYTLKTIQLYYEDVPSCELWKVKLEDTLYSVLTRKSYEVQCGTPTFLVLCTVTPFLEHFTDRPYL